MDNRTKFSVKIFSKKLKNRRKGILKYKKMTRMNMLIL